MEPELTETGEYKFKRILLSDVIVKRPKNVFMGRKWIPMDVATAGVVAAMHLLSLFAPFQFNWGAFWVAMALYVVTGLFGITLSFHRNLSHKSFKLPKFLEYLFAYCGSQALQVRISNLNLVVFQNIFGGHFFSTIHSLTQLHYQLFFFFVLNCY